MKVAAIYGPRATADDARRFQQSVSGTFATQITDDLDAVLIFGGDGTIHRHLARVGELKIPMLPVPTGSGNDFASSLGIHSPLHALRLWQQFSSSRANVRSVDLGHVTSHQPLATHHFFSNVANLGLDADINRRANRLPALIRAHGGYILSLFPALVSYKSQPVTLTCLDEDSSRTFAESVMLVAFANGPRYGHGLRIAPNADMSDGVLDICLVRRASKLKIATLFPLVYFGRHLNLPEVEYFRCRRIRVETLTPTDIYADGEYLCQTPAEISIASHALRVIAPRRS
jgi:diacylglycerol kinase (ATP)